MTELRSVTVEQAPAATDAFGNLRVSSPTGLFAYQHQYDAGPLNWEYLITAGGALTHLPLESTVELSTTVAAGDAITKHSRAYFRYQPGKSQLLKLTGVLGSPQTDLLRQVGIFDDANGLFFEQDAVGLGVVVRTNTTGAPVETRVPQASWNLDPMDGTGPSGVTLDETKAQIFVIDLQWLGVGRVRFGFNLAGVTQYVHEVLNANVQNVVYTQTANLPIRYRLENVGAQGAPRTMKAICAAVDSEGGFEIEHGLPFCADTGCDETTVLSCVPRAVLSVRPKLLLNGQVNRALFLPTSFDLLGRTQALNFQIAYNLDFPAGPPVWTSANANSGMEYTTHAVGAGAFVTNTRSILTSCGFIPVGGTGNSRTAGTRGGAQDIFLRLPIGLDAAGANPTAVSIIAQGVDGNGLMGAGINWLEFR